MRLYYSLSIGYNDTVDKYPDSTSSAWPGREYRPSFQQDLS